MANQALRATLFLLIAYMIYAATCALYLYVFTSAGVPAPMQGTAADPRLFMDDQLLSQSVEYSRIRNWLYFLLLPIDWFVYASALIWGSVLRPGERLTARFSRPSFGVMAYASMLLAISLVIKLPLSFYAYRLAVRHDISVQAPFDWLRDRLIAFSLDALVWVLVLALIVRLIQRSRRWWLHAWMMLVPAIVFYMFIQPVWIDPLFNDFSRMDNSHLESRILQLADESGIETDRVYVVNMSEKSNAVNAYVNGIGPSLRIVLWDTLLERMEEDEILFVMAHEIGHYTMNHLYWSTAGFVIGAFILLFAGHKLLNALVRRYGKGWGIAALGQASAVPLILLVFSLLMFAFQPYANAISRQAEHSADRYALELTQNADAAVRAFQNMAIASKSDVHPPALVKWVRSGHPTLAERIFFAIRYDPLSSD